MEGNDIVMPSQVLGCDFPGISEQREYYFETDHESLRGNKDYLALLRTMAIVQAQKIQAIQDVEKLLDYRKKALDDPLVFVEKLRRGEIRDLPKRRKLPSMPVIDWTNYNLTCAQEDKLQARKNVADQQGLDENMTDSKSEERLLDNPREKKNNQSWNTKKRKQLEELIANYPFEDVESEKWKEIKDVFGCKPQNQTLQKFSTYTEEKYNMFEGQRKKNVASFDQLDWSITHSHEQRPTQKPADDYFFVVDDVSEEEEIDEMKKSSDTYHELMWLKRIRREKEFQISEGVQIHDGFRCNGCEVMPIRFGRFTCTDCHKIGIDVHFCCECVSKMIEFQHLGHFKDHTVRAARKKTV